METVDIQNFPETVVESEETATFEHEGRLADATTESFVAANRELWDNPEEDAAWADW